MFGKNKKQQPSTQVINTDLQESGASIENEKSVVEQAPSETESAQEPAKMTNFIFVEEAIALPDGNYRYIILTDRKIAPGLMEEE